MLLIFSKMILSTLLCLSQPSIHKITFFGVALVLRLCLTLVTLFVPVLLVLRSCRPRVVIVSHSRIYIEETKTK